MDKFGHELRVYQVKFNFMSVEIQRSPSHISDLRGQLNRSRQMHHDFVVHENARSNVIAHAARGTKLSFVVG